MVDYFHICMLDPTVRVVNNNAQSGKYCNWLLQHVTPEQSRSDEFCHSMKVALEQYNDGFKRGILKRNGISNDIGSFKTTDEFLNTMQQLMGQGQQISQSMSNKMEELKGQYEIVAESPNWFIVNPKTYEAERYFGSSTDWCTVANKDYFDSYNRKGPLYITYPKNGNDKLKMQFHFATNSYASYDDEVYKNPKECVYQVLGDGDDFNEVYSMWEKNNGAFANFKFIKFSEVPELLAKHTPLREIFNYVFTLNNNNYVTVGLNGRYNFIGKDEKGDFTRLVSPDKWFYNVHGHFNDIEGEESFIVEPECGGYNVLTQDGKILLKNNVTRIGKMHYGWAFCCFPDKFKSSNFINDKGETLLPENVSVTYDFENGYGKFYVDGKGFNVVDTKGKIILDKYYSQIYTTPYRDQFIVMVKDAVYNIINLDNTFITPNQTYISVKVNTEWNGYEVNIKNILYTKDAYTAGGSIQFAGNLRKFLLKRDGTLCDSPNIYHEPQPLSQAEIDELGIHIQQPAQQVSESKQTKGRRIYLTENQVSEIQQKLQQARSETNTNPTEGQKHAGNYKMGRVNILGYDIAIENPKGTYRSGKDKNGKEWKILMQNDYGYFTHTLGQDGDAIDVFIGSNFQTNSIFAIDQRIDGKFDETKIMLGFKTEQQAKEAYLANYEKDWKGFWKITEVSHEVFQNWLYDGYKQRKPFFKYAEIKKNKLNEEMVKAYHGSPCTTIGKFKKGSHGVLGPGIYFSEEKDYTTKYAKKYGSGAIYEVEIELYKPLVLTSDNPTKDFLDFVYKTESVYRRREQKQSNINYMVETKDVKKFLSMGYDGVIWDYAGNKEYVVYDGSKITILNKDDMISESSFQDAEEWGKWWKDIVRTKQHNGVVTLYHNTTCKSLEHILFDKELSTKQHHTEGHGDMLFFTVNPEAWGNECKIAIDVPVDEFTGSYDGFHFVNTDSVVYEHNIPINKYNFRILEVKHLTSDRIFEILRGDYNMKQEQEYIYEKFFDGIPCIANWFTDRI